MKKKLSSSLLPYNISSSVRSEQTSFVFHSRYINADSRPLTIKCDYVHTIMLPIVGIYVVIVVFGEIMASLEMLSVVLGRRYLIEYRYSQLQQI